MRFLLPAMFLLTFGGLGWSFPWWLWALGAICALESPTSLSRMRSISDRLARLEEKSSR